MFICGFQLLIQWERFVEQLAFVLHRLLVRIALERVTDLLVFMGAGVALLSTDSAVERETRSHNKHTLTCSKHSSKAICGTFCLCFISMGVYCSCLHRNLVGCSHDSANTNVNVA